MNVLDTSSSQPPPMAFADVPDPAPGPTTSSGIATAGTISESDIHSLLAYFWSFNPSTTPRDAPDLVHIHTVVTRLFAKDYDLALVDNDWCSSYPHQLIIPTRQRHPVNPGSSAALVNNPTTLVPLFRNSRFSRVRSRFVVPVLLLNGRNICRSSTLSNEAEVQLNSIAEKAKYLKRQLFSSASAMTADLPGAAAGRPRSPASPPPPPPIPGSTTSSATSQPSSDTDDPVETTPSLSTMERQRLADIALLRALQVTDIFDLMVENRKVKAFFTITSSEKADTRNRYAEFAVVPIPYPGVEFFEDFKSRGYCGKELRFDWMQAFADAELKVERAGAWRHRHRLAETTSRDKSEGGLIGEVPPVQVLSNVDLWREWRNWDIIRMTQHYLQLILHSLVAPAPPTAPSPSATTLPHPTSPTLVPTEASVSSSPLPPSAADATIGGTASPPLSGNGGINIHCISGWDRTPAFISWVRLSLWADGLAHQSLCAEEILYLTVAYDWLLFSHLLADRVKNSQEIFAFCFYMLLFILDEREFGVANKVHAEATAPVEPAEKGRKQARKRMPTLSTSAPTASGTPPLVDPAVAHPESSPTLSDFAHTPQSPPQLATSIHGQHSYSTRPVDVPAMRRHHLPRRPSNASTASCCTPPLAPSVIHPPATYSSSSASSLLTMSGPTRRTSHGQGHGDSPLMLAADTITPPRSVSAVLAARGTTPCCGDSVSSAASSLCSVPCQLDASAPPGSMINGRTPAAPVATHSGGSGSVQYSSSWQLISYMQQQQQQLAGSSSSSSGAPQVTPKRSTGGGSHATRPRAPSTGSLGRGQHRSSHSWTLEDDLGGRAGAGGPGVAGSVSPAIAPTLGMLAASPSVSTGVHVLGRGLVGHASPSSLSGQAAKTPPESPALDHDQHDAHVDPTFDDDADADADIDDVDDLEFANARRVSAVTASQPARKPATPTLAGFAHRPSPVPGAGAGAGSTGSWSWTVASKETTPSPVVVPSVPPAANLQHNAHHHHHHHQHHVVSSSSSSSSARSSRWSLGTSGGVMLASPQAHAAATGNVNGGPNPASAVGFQMSTTTTGHTPVAHVHQRRQVHEHKRTLSMSGSWDPNMSPTTATALSTSTEMAGANASSVVGKAIARPVSTPAGVWETKTQRSGERLVEFAPFSACACCQLPGTAGVTQEGSAEDEDLFAMDGSLMLVPGPPGSNLSLGADHLSSPVSRSNTGDDESDELMSSVHGNGSLDDPDPLVHARNDRKLEGVAASSSPPTLSSPSSSSPSALLSTTRAQRLLRVRNLFVQAYRPLTQPITAPPLSAKDWPPLPSRPSPAAIAVSAPSLAAPESRVRMGVSPPPIAAASPAPASSSSGVLQPQPLNAGILGGGGGSGGGWTSSLSSMMAKMAGVPQAPPVTVSQPLLSSTSSRPNGTCSPPTSAAPLAVPTPLAPLHAHYMQPLTSLLPTPPMSAGNHASTSSSATTAAPTGSTPGALTMPPSWRSVHQQQLHRATSPAAGAGASAALSPSAPPSAMGYPHHYMSPLVSPIGGANTGGGVSGVYRTSAAGANGGGVGGGGGTSGFRDSWFR